MAEPLRVFTFGPIHGLPTSGPFGLKLELALRIAGVPYERVYEEDNRKGPKRKSPWIEQGSVRMGLLQNSRTTILKDQGLPVDYLWNDAFFSWTAAAVPKYAPHADAAFALVNTMAGPEEQAQFARLTKYGPMNSKAEELLDDATRDQLPNAHIDEQCEVDNTGLAKDMAEYGERYTAWLGQG